jgi:hypothetical protein
MVGFLSDKDRRLLNPFDNTVGRDLRGDFVEVQEEAEIGRGIPWGNAKVSIGERP